MINIVDEGLLFCEDRDCVVTVEECSKCEYFESADVKDGEGDTECNIDWDDGEKPSNPDPYYVEGLEDPE